MNNHVLFFPHGNLLLKAMSIGIALSFNYAANAAYDAYDYNYSPPTSELSALLNNEHTPEYAYFYTTNSDGSPKQWYIAGSDGKVYFLSKFIDGAAGWGLLCSKTDSTSVAVSTPDFANNLVKINEDFSNNCPATGYYDVYSNGNLLSGINARQLAADIEGKTFNVSWYFFNSPYSGFSEVWYITQPQRTSKDLWILKFNQANNPDIGNQPDYKWQIISAGTKWVPRFYVPTTSRRVPSTPKLILQDSAANSVIKPLPTDQPITAPLESDYKPAINEVEHLDTSPPQTPQQTTETVIENNIPVTATVPVLPPIPTVIAKNCNADTFTDVFLSTLGQENYDQTEALCSTGVIVGYLTEQQPDGKRPFKPANTATYAEALKVLVYVNDYDGLKSECNMSNGTDNPSTWWQCPLNVANRKLSSQISSNLINSSINRGQAFIITAKLFFDYSATSETDAANYLAKKGVLRSTNTTNGLDRAALVALSVKAAKAAGRVVPYGDVPSTKLFANLDDNNNTSNLLPTPKTPVFPVKTDSNVDIDAVITKALGEKGKKGGLWTDSTTTYCARFVRVMYSMPPVFPSAYQMCDSFRNQNKLSTGTPTPGSVVCYQKSKGNGYYGHVSIATNSGTEIGVTSVSKGVTEKVLGSVGTLMGYVTPGNFVTYYPK